jgi:hypothetical protein
MIAPCFGPDNQRGFIPCLAPKPLRQVIREHHGKNGNQGFVTLSENDRTLANDDQSRLTRPSLHALQLVRRMRKHTGKQTSRGQMFRGRLTIIHHTPPHLKPAGPFLRMFTHDAIRLWPIRRTPGDEVKFLVLPNHPRLTKVSVTDLIPIHQSIGHRRTAGQSHALRLGFHGHKPSARTTPRTDHAHRPNATAQIQTRFHGRCPRSPIPRRQRIIRGKAVSMLQLQDPKMATKSRARLPLASHRHSRRNGARLRPAFENGSHLIRHFSAVDHPGQNGNHSVADDKASTRSKLRASAAFILHHGPRTRNDVSRLRNLSPETRCRKGRHTHSAQSNSACASTVFTASSCKSGG